MMQGIGFHFQCCMRHVSRTAVRDTAPPFGIIYLLIRPPDYDSRDSGGLIFYRSSFFKCKQHLSQGRWCSSVEEDMTSRREERDKL